MNLQFAAARRAMGSRSRNLTRPSPRATHFLSPLNFFYLPGEVNPIKERPRKNATARLAIEKRFFSPITHTYYDTAFLEGVFDTQPCDRILNTKVNGRGTKVAALRLWTGVSRDT